LGAHRHRADTRVHLARLEADGRLLEVTGNRAFGVGLDDEHALTAVGGKERRGCGDRALADPALAGEEQQAPPQEVGRGSTGQMLPKPTRFDPSSESTST